MTDKIFKQLIKQNEARRYLIYLFKSKYDRIDFNYLENKNICKIFEYFIIEFLINYSGINGAMRKNSSNDQDPEIARENGIEYEIVSPQNNVGPDLSTISENMSLS